MNQYKTTLAELISLLENNDPDDFEEALYSLKEEASYSYPPPNKEPELVVVYIDEDGQDPLEYIRIMEFQIWYPDTIVFAYMKEETGTDLIWAPRNPPNNLTNWSEHYTKTYKKAIDQ